MRAQDLVPPYQSLRAVASGPPPLGTIRMVDATSPATIAADVRALTVSAPWVVPCVSLRGFTPDLLLEVLPPHLLRRVGIISVSPPGGRPSVFGVLQAVAARPAPRPEDIADYVVTRLRRTDARGALLSAMESEEVRSRPGFVLRMLDGLGRLKPHEWKLVHWLAEKAASAGGERQDGLDESLAFWSGVLLAQGPRAMREFMGWEWVVERALRAAGYVEEPDAPAGGGSRRDGPLVGPLAPTWQYRTVRLAETPSGHYRLRHC